MSHFFAYLSRMRLIRRWGLMNSITPENIQEHSLQVAMIAQTLAVIGNRLFDRSYNPERTAVLAMYHDASEVITGDLPTPIKYFSPKINAAYKEIEEIANRRLVNLLPEGLQADFESIFFPAEDDEPLWKLVKAADKITAYLKCEDELKVGNREFAQASRALLDAINGIDMPEVAYFMETFVPSFSLTLDELE